MITRSDIFKKRGIEYDILSEGDDFSNNTEIIVNHHHPYYFSKDTHSFSVKAYFMANTAFICPICDKYSYLKLSKRIGNILKKLDVEHIKSYRTEDKILFNYLIKTKKKDLYVKCFDKRYYINAIDEGHSILRIRDYCKKNKLKLIEISCNSYKKDVKKLKKLIKKYS